MFADNKIVRYINQNRGKIITIFLVIIFAFLIIYTLNELSKQKNEEQSNVVPQNIYRPENTAISGDSVPAEQQQENESVIDKFIEFCNNGQVEEAYNLLSDNCKEKIYPTIETFSTSYYDVIFTTKREVTIQSWINDGDFYVYQVRYLNDMMATGKIDEGNIYEDYISIEKATPEKINIGQYIGTEQIESSKEEENIKVTVNRVDYYLRQAVYIVTVQNNSNNNIYIDSKTKTDSVYLTDSNELHWNTSINNVADAQLMVSPGLSRTYQISFQREYNPDVWIETFTFSDIRVQEITNDNEVKEITVEI